jgi:deazaflavin-dependent oxidoreductase (nitroreductase family)
MVNHVVNPIVRGVLRSPLHRLLSSPLVVLSYTGRRSGRRRSLPVMYVQDGSRLVVFATHPERKRWWRNFRDGGAPVDVRLRGEVVHGRAGVVSDPALVDEGRALYTARFPNAAPSVRDAVMVAVTLRR